jgi:hypothetical protein
LNAFVQGKPPGTNTRRETVAAILGLLTAGSLLPGALTTPAAAQASGVGVIWHVVSCDFKPSL